MVLRLTNLRIALLRTVLCIANENCHRDDPTETANPIPWPAHLLSPLAAERGLQSKSTVKGTLSREQDRRKRKEWMGHLGSVRARLALPCG